MNTKTMTSLIAVTLIASFAAPNAFAFDVLHSFTLTEGGSSADPGTEYVGTFGIDSEDLTPNNFIPVANFSSFEVTVQTTSFTQGDHTGSTPDLDSEGVSTDGTGAVYTFEDQYPGFVFVTFTTDGFANTLNLEENGDWDYTPAVGPMRNGTWTITVASPESQAEDLIDEIEGLGLNSGNENALTKKIENAIKNLTNDDPTDDAEACDKLDAFINQLNAFVNSGKLTQEQVDPLIDAAEFIQNQIGC
ncbi:MAG: hypothetical protein PVJ16_09265 [Nitrosopumilaceae archaeon]|jgi:hypothetical protein